MHNIHNLHYSSVCYDMNFDMKSENQWGFSQQQ